MSDFLNAISGRKVLFITTKNIDYIRNTQELRLIREKADTVEVVYSTKKNYALRILDVWKQISRVKILNSDVVFIGFEPQFVYPFLDRGFRDKTVIADCFISVYDTLICDRKNFSAKGLVAKLSHWMDQKTLRGADIIIADTQEHARYFAEEFCVPLSKFEVIYLEADKSIYYPRKQNKLDNKFVVLYFGSILPLQGVDIVLEAIRVLRERDDIFFDIIGPIPENYQKPIQTNVHYTEWLQQEELAEHIADADLCLAGHFNSAIDKAWRTIPGKAYIYEAMNKKMVLGEGKANRELFVEDGKHIFAERGNVDALVEAILKGKSDECVN